MVTQGHVEDIQIVIPAWYLILNGMTSTMQEDGSPLVVKVGRITGVCQPFRTLESNWDEKVEREREHQNMLKQ